MTRPRRRVTREVLADVAERLGETAVYASLVGTSMMYDAVAFPPGPLHLVVRPGGRFGLLETRTGRAVLAYLPASVVDHALVAQVSPTVAPSARRELHRQLVLSARRGWTSGTGHRWPGVWAVAVPVFDRWPRPVGAVGIAAPIVAAQPDGPDPARRSLLVAEAVAAASRLSLSAGGPPAPPPAPLLRRLPSGAPQLRAVRR